MSEAAGSCSCLWCDLFEGGGSDVITETGAVTDEKEGMRAMREMTGWSGVQSTEHGTRTQDTVSKVLMCADDSHQDADHDDEKGRVAGCGSMRAE